ncbi:MAG: preprotein translocase subunit SecY [Tissierellia bacterium]|nr:preprotein translocase subunit SecY [Tissierellia bacterium]
MIKMLRDAWKLPEIRKKIIFTLLMLLVIRLGSAVPVPFMNKQAITELFAKNEGSLLSFLDLMAGGNLSSFSIFAANIYPYITASIVIQLLTIAIPRLEELAKEGEEGQKKIQKYTRIGGIALALIQAIGMTFGMLSRAVETTGMLQNIVIIASIVAGTAFLMWIGEMITERGIGNGISLIIFIGIISRLPRDLISAVKRIQMGLLNPITAILFLIVFLAIIVFVVRLQEGERRVPVQYAKRVVGRKMYGGQNTHIPIKVSLAGVIPVIFAQSILAIPQTISLFTKGGTSPWIEKWLTPSGSIGIWLYSILNILLIMFFAYFYTAIQFNTVEYAKNLQQNGGFVPGIRPGKPTSDYLTRVVNRLVFVGGISLAFLATIPTVLSKIFRMPVNFGGTSIIIVVGVALETVKAIESQMLMRHYKGFLR